ISVPLFNLILRLHPVGKHALSQEQKLASNWVGIGLLLVLIFAGVWVGLHPVLGEWGTVTFAVLLLPLCGVFLCHAGWPRLLMAAITAVLFLLGTASLAVELVPYAPSKARLALSESLYAYFLWGALLSQFAANF